MKIKLFKSQKISWKLTIYYATIFSLVLMMLSASVLYGIRLYLINQAINKAMDTSNSIIERINGSTGEQMSLDDPELFAAEQDSTISARIVNSKKIMINSLNKFNWSKLQILADNSVKKTEIDKLHLVVANRQILNRDKVIAYLQVVVNMNKEYVFLEALFVLMACADLVGIAISLFAGYLMSRRMLYPIDRITRAAQSISVHDLNRRIEVSQTDDELSRLAKTFNEMIERLHLSFEKQKQFVSDASHELRTPISVILGYIGLIDRWGKEDTDVLHESINAIKNESIGMMELIEKLLFLAKGDSGNQKLKIHEFSFNELIDEVGKESELISQKHLIQYTSVGEISLLADRKMIKQMLRALIDNSVKFTPENGSITLLAYSNNNSVNINIKDTGIGIPSQEVIRIFDRFYRTDKARAKETGGSGLGLAIVKWIVDAHKGKIAVESNIGEGTNITVELPQLMNYKAET
ncbi:ATP-binding protein [Desulfosporosinus sp. BG]|uniref:sensor histidine kinase n=1 Tax=Desulfosporosinus sp. BG TaxID=1633135 RepID=UPI00083B659B|nr:ATP-binding protein [Desulfosporosinus sp. BG]ODA42743.1 sensor histidine kinase [Desulfosporosinus sp. BG]